MKIINLGRGQGKTTRLLYASEFNDTPILCANMIHKKALIRQAKEMGLFIPEPICVHEVFSNYTKGKDIDGVLVDDAELVLQNVLNSIGFNNTIMAMSVTDITDANRYVSSNKVTWSRTLDKIDKAIKDYADSCNTVGSSIDKLSDVLSTTEC